MNQAIFEPFEYGALQLKNRIVLAPMTRSFSPGHVPNQQNVAYYQRRAANGVGLIVTEGTCVGHKAANGYPDVPFFFGDEALAGWRKVVDAVHEAGGKIMPQLWHVGGVRKDCLQPDESVPAFSPSGLLSPNKPNGVAMTQDDIDEVIAAFIEAAVQAQKLGFDGVEIHGAHGYLLDQFFWEKTNLRNDEYGGNLAQRTRFATEMISQMRQAVGPEFPIVLRFSQWKLQNYALKLAETPEDLKAFLDPLVAAGVDMFHCSTRRFWEPEFTGSDLNLAGWTKKLTGKPCITVGSVGLAGGFVDEDKKGMSAQSEVSTEQFELIEKSLIANEYDLVAVGRCLLQDPAWVHKLKAGQYTEMKPYTAESLKNLY
ncbi:NADH:flavin oxidoreductase [Marinicella litoralis]|uniref:2,4-dienoyl-CoA reductase-like NADH-dependent reductase (Old Yellow Enzyme family) n=1 Tax=Marinicella litoralis TaxID=644220 RepID=A0A4R6XTJ9_9GAMM|nr:NADH:flavin oxidoreductase [Marinicella litoralis]TDR20773.1 2,4-dienoyl-CoA reductase-like NADH-dependent reductase (Old Yellow Enzyme family) [Marinicella litoralis]